MLARMRKLPKPPERRFRRVLTTPNVLATIAVLMAAAAPAYAAMTYTGLHVKNGTLEGRDVKNYALGSVDFTAATATTLRVKGDPGDKGPTGATGETGTTGLKGATGDKGTPAPRAFTFQTTKQPGTARIQDHQPNPTTGELIPACGADPSDDLVNCPGFYMDDADVGRIFPRWNFKCTNIHCNVNAVSMPRMESSFQTVMQTSQSANGGFLNMPHSGTILLNASATFYTQRTDSQQRVDCQLQVSRILNGFPQSPVNVGVPITVYRLQEGNNGSVGALNRQERLLTLHVTGAVAETAGVFDSQLACRSLDDSGDPDDRVEFIEGNMSVLTTRTNGQA